MKRVEHSDGGAGPLAGSESADKVIRLLGAILTRGMTKTDAIVALSQLDLAPREIARIVGVTPNRVSVTLYKEKRSRPAEPETTPDAD